MMPSPGAPHRSRSALINLALAAIGCTSVVLYRAGSQAEGTKDVVWFIQLALAQSVLYLIAAWLVLRARPVRATLVIAILLATLFRLSLVHGPPRLSDDVTRPWRACETKGSIRRSIAAIMLIQFTRP